MKFDRRTAFSSLLAAGAISALGTQEIHTAKSQHVDA